MEPIYYSQYDPLWASIPYPSQDNPNGTILTSACDPTCAAMVVATLVNPKITPADMAKLAIKLGDRVNGGTEDTFNFHVAKEYNLSFSQILKDNVIKDRAGSLKQAIVVLQNGKLVICRMQDWFKVGAGHFILAWGVSGNQIHIHDPASKANTAKLWDQSVFLEKCIGYFIFSKS